MAAVIFQCSSGGFEEVKAVWRGTPAETWVVLKGASHLWVLQKNLILCENNPHTKGVE